MGEIEQARADRVVDGGRFFGFRRVTSAEHCHGGWCQRYVLQGYGMVPVLY